MWPYIEGFSLETLFILTQLYLHLLQRDFISLLPKKGLDHLAENILSFLDAKSLAAAQRVCKGWLHVISEGKKAPKKCGIWQEEKHL